MSIAVKQDRGNRVTFRSVIDLDDRLQEAIRTGWFYYLEALKERANKASLAKDKRGNVYVSRDRGGRRRRHRASAPGQSHANRSGALRKSLSWKVRGWKNARFGYGVATNASNKAPEYAGFVERGTRRMEARPTLSNAVEKEEIQKHFDRAFDREFMF